MRSTIWEDISLQATMAGVLAAFVGFGGSFAVVVSGLRAAGASPAQAASGLLALSVVMGICGIYISARTRVPISVAWSTPGAALLASAPPVHGGYGYAVGAFIVCGVLIIFTGLWSPLGRAVAAIPRSLVSAMLAGVVFSLCLAPILGLREKPLFVLIILAVWLVVSRIRRVLAVPAAVVVAIGLAALTLHGGRTDLSLWPRVVWVMPHFSLSAIVSVALPMFVVTMAGQNIPGFAVLNLNGYRPRPGPILTATGIASLLVTPFGGHTINLAAITAALCAGHEAHADPARRWWAGAVNGAVYVVFGLLSGVITTFVALSAPVLIFAVAGVALFGVLGVSLAAAAAEPADRDAAMVTFLLSASGMHIAGVGGAFWGLVGGGAILGVQRYRKLT